ncbi:MAG: nucleotidyltransferase [Acidobacteriaceae bacterium]|nr:nucleotidyltransferase [Acidobacteriaceae bacterium]
MNIESSVLREQVARCRLWPARLPQARWGLYKRVMTAARDRNVPFAVGGGLVAMTYAGQWRDTKDIDLYIRPGDRDRMIEIVRQAGMADYFERQPYDRKWIYRSYWKDSIVDVMWCMANQRAKVDDSWMDGPQVEIDGLQVHLLAPEDAIWTKLYVVQFDRCDWPDAMNMLYALGTELDWHRFLSKVEPDAPLVGALLAAFRWLCPAKASQFPAWIWSELGLSDGAFKGPAICDSGRAHLLDTRPWFTPAIEDRARLLQD